MQEQKAGGRATALGINLDSNDRPRQWDAVKTRHFRRCRHEPLPHMYISSQSAKSAHQLLAPGAVRRPAKGIPAPGLLLMSRKFLPRGCNVAFLYSTFLWCGEGETLDFLCEFSMRGSCGCAHNSIFLENFKTFSRRNQNIYIIMKKEH